MHVHTAHQYSLLVWCGHSRRQHTSAYVGIRQHTSAYVSIPISTRCWLMLRALRTLFLALPQALFMLYALYFRFTYAVPDGGAKLRGLELKAEYAF